MVPDCSGRRLDFCDSSIASVRPIFSETEGFKSWSTYRSISFGLWEMVSSVRVEEEEAETGPRRRENTSRRRESRLKGEVQVENKNSESIQIPAFPEASKV